MYDDLYEYFVLNHQLSLPGIGAFVLEKTPAKTEIVNRVIQPPSYSISFHQATSTPTKNFFVWLAGRMNISYSEAIVGFNAFAYDLRSEILSGGMVVWPKLGTLRGGPGNEIFLDPANESLSPEAPVPAEKVIRDNAQHTIRVGEEERTSGEMEELLHHEVKNARGWWIAALIIAAICLAVIVYAFSTSGPGTGNRQRLQPGEPPTVHRLIE